MFLIGIAGRSGSGKTRLAGEFVRLQPQASVLGMDSYYQDLSELPAAERAAVNFDAPAALDWGLLIEHLERLRAGVPVKVPRYDFVTHMRLAESAVLVPGDLLVLEGLFTLFDRRIRAMLDLAVFIDLDEAEGLWRRIRRDTDGRGRTETFVRRQWERDVAPMYALHVSPTRAHADMMLDGASPPSAAASTLSNEFARLVTARRIPSLHST